MARRQSAPRLEFEAAAIYAYPEHLRPWLEALPKQPGVYLFHGESDTLPLYINIGTARRTQTQHGLTVLFMVCPKSTARRFVMPVTLVVSDVTQRR